MTIDQITKKLYTHPEPNMGFAIVEYPNGSIDVLDLFEFSELSDKKPKISGYTTLVQGRNNTIKTLSSILANNLKALSKLAKDCHKQDKDSAKSQKKKHKEN